MTKQLPEQSMVATCPRQTRDDRSVPSNFPSDAARSISGQGGDASETEARAQPRWKRSIDVVVASMGLLLLAPLFLCVAVLVKSGSKGPVFFRQQRIGLHGKPFRMWKFRTMLVTHDPREHQQYVVGLTRSNDVLRKLNHQDQMIRGATLMRALCLDELPQLINVLLGEMSLVGPRPDVVPIEAYDEWQRGRFAVLPGITGLWQIRGKNRTTFEGMMRLDLDYVQNRSLALDVNILLMTVPAIVRELFGRDPTAET